ncbi:hypothetical protein HKI87_14g76720 [Chloropicon roscoffensis]|uniref:Uncharacterized protein n=1 Tax=Chloropicon roscoffensis TaxID=1461544 RepID=A0AAX4PKA4_9CHLO
MKPGLRLALLLLVALSCAARSMAVWSAGSPGLRLDGRPPRRRGFANSLPGGVDFSKVAMRSVKHKTCSPKDPKCKAVKPVLSVTLDPQLPLESCSPPRTDDPKASRTSSAYCVFRLLPAEALWVNLNPNEPERVMDARMSGTETGRVLLESDLWLKKTAAVYLHPDHELGDRFWREVYGWVGKGRNGRLCYSLRQWIVPGEIQVAHTVARNPNTGGREVTVHLLKATMAVRHEGAFEEALQSESGKRSAKRVEAMMDKMCRGANRTLKRHAEETYESLVLPQVERHVNSSPEYERLRLLYYWRIVSEYAKGLVERERGEIQGDGSGEGEAAHPGEGVADMQARTAVVLEGRNLSSLDPILDEGWTKETLFKSYLRSASKGEFLLKREVEEEGIVYLRTYFHGEIDWSRPFLV